MTKLSIEFVYHFMVHSIDTVFGKLAAIFLQLPWQDLGRERQERMENKKR